MNPLLMEVQGSLVQTRKQWKNVYRKAGRERNINTLNTLKYMQQTREQMKLAHNRYIKMPKKLTGIF